MSRVEMKEYSKRATEKWKYKMECFFPVKVKEKNQPSNKFLALVFGEV